ncbi:Nitric oxide-responding transcriptional regulator Dnr (Crp/Fnr family) [hydrothermal vent metagenome]|uniref:Nitric oxide-responding transcriptional regulator Dnr (Crp/Fnr family) n=1 Tax=hydrothermal vent metagenome TaxID=652676 RepID=A0A1W1CT45_9ZZZZ
MIKKIKMSFTVISMLTISLSAVEITSPTDAVDIAGKQRMFTQRMLKDYAMVGMGNTFGNPEEDLKKISVAFQDHMESLLAYTKSDDTKKSIAKVEALWKPLYKILVNAPSKEKVEKLQIDLDTLLKASDDTTKLFVKESGKASGEIVNKAGRQRMLSQRMASLYMLKVWGVDDSQFKKKLDNAMKLFKDSLSDLEKSDLNTDEINVLLAKVKRSFMFFEMMSKSKSKFVPTLIYKKSNDILTNMNSATQKYVALETK